MGHARCRTWSRRVGLWISVALVAAGSSLLVDSAGSGAAVAAAPNGQQGQVLLDDSFTGATSTSPVVALHGSGTASAGYPCLTAGTATTTTPLPGCGLTPPDPTGSGTLRLTDTGDNEASGLLYGTSFPTSEGLDITFDQYQYGGSGADGISFDLAAAPPQPDAIGPPGGSLGYSSSGGGAGLPGGYLGVGLDVFGNFTSTNFQGLGCTNPSWASPVEQPNSVTVRGPGDGTVGYCLLSSSVEQGPLGFSLRGTSRADSARAVQVVVDPATQTYTVSVDPSGGTDYTTVTSGSLPSSYYDPTTGTLVAGLPPRLTFGFAASTGSFTDDHEISDVVASTLSGTVPVLGLADVDSDGGSIPAGAAFSYALTPSVSAVGGPESDPTSLHVTDTLPSDVSAVSTPSGTSWDCGASTSSTVSCVYTGTVALPPGTALPAITVPVQLSAAATPGQAVDDTAQVISSDAAAPVTASDDASVASAGSGSTPTQLAFLTEPPATVVAGTAPPDLSVVAAVENAHGGIISDSADVLALSSTPSGPTAMATAVDGVATFSFPPPAPGTGYQLQATDTTTSGLTPAHSTPFAVEAADASMQVTVNGPDDPSLHGAVLDADSPSLGTSVSATIAGPGITTLSGLGAAADWDLSLVSSAGKVLAGVSAITEMAGTVTDVALTPKLSATVDVRVTDPAGAVPGAVVDAVDLATGRYVSNATTAADGTATVRGLVQHEAVELAVVSAPFPDAANVSTTLTPGAGTNHASFALPTIPLFTSDPSAVGPDGVARAAWSSLLPPATPASGNDSSIGSSADFAGVDFTFTWGTGQHLVLSADAAGTEPFCVNGSWTLQVSGPTTDRVVGRGCPATGGVLDLSSLSLSPGTYGAQLTLTTPAQGTTYGSTDVYVSGDHLNDVAQQVIDTPAPLVLTGGVTLPVGGSGVLDATVASAAKPFSGVHTVFGFDQGGLAVTAVAFPDGWSGGDRDNFANGDGGFLETGPVTDAGSVVDLSVTCLAPGTWPVSFLGDYWGPGSVSESDYSNSVSGDPSVDCTGGAPAGGSSDVSVDPTDGTLHITATGSGLGAATAAVLTDGGQTSDTATSVTPASGGDAATVVLPPTAPGTDTLVLTDAAGQQVGSVSNVLIPPVTPWVSVQQTDLEVQIPGIPTTHIFRVTNSGLVDATAIVDFVFPLQTTTEPTLVANLTPATLLTHTKESGGWLEVVSVPVAAGTSVDVPWTVDLDPNAVFGSNPSVPVGSTFPFLSDVIGTLTAAEQAAASSDSLATEIQTAIRDQNTDTLPIAGLQLIPAAEQAAYQAALTAQYPVLGAALYQAQSDDLGSSLGAIGGLAGSSGTDAAHRVGSPHDGPRLGAAAAAPAATPAVAPRDGSDPNNPNDVANDATGGITIGNVFQNGGQDLPNPVDLLNPPPPSASEQSTINTLATAAGNTPHSTVVSASDCGAAQANVSQSLAPLIPPGWSMQPVEGIVPPSYYQGMSGSSGITGLVGEYMVFASMEVSNSFGGYYPAHYATMVTAPSGNSYLIDTYLGSVSVAQMAPIIPPSIPLKPTQAWVLSPNSPSGDALDYATALTTTWIPFSPGANSVTITAGACPLPPHANVPQSTGKPPGATTATSTDPNSIGAFPTGAGAANWIPGGQPLSYVIHFENEPTATAPAVNIRVRVPLDANLDPSTLQFPADLNPYGPTTETYAPATRTITFELPNVDLPPDTAPPNGENQVGFTAQPLASTTTGTPIDESAQVFFDYNPPVATGTILRTVNTTAPTVTLTPFTATEAAGPVTVGWQPDSAPGVADYAVDVSTDGGPLQPLESTTSTSIQFPAAAGHRYQFSVTATDVTGLTGPASPPEGFLTAGAVAPPDVTALSQNSGSPQGYQEVVLDGTGFTGATSVAFGASPALQFTVENDTRILAVVPPGAGTVPVVVTTPVGSSPAEGPTYTYIPPTPGTTPPTVGGGGGGPGPTAVGYRLVGADGGVFAFDGAGYFGSEGGHRLAAPVVGIAATPDGGGYWLVGSDGGVFSFGDAAFEGSLPVRGVHVKDVVGMVGTPDGRGYWLVASDGGVFSFGDATFFGSMGGAALARPVVGLAPTTDGRGYWLVGSDGGVFSFGDARFIGSEGGHTLQAPIVGIASAHGSSGYWLVGSDGGVFSFGTARFFGSAGGSALTAPVVGIGATSDGGGYTLAERDGSARSFGDAAAGRSLSGIALNSPVTAIAG